MLEEESSSPVSPKSNNFSTESLRTSPSLTGVAGVRCHDFFCFTLHRCIRLSDKNIGIFLLQHCLLGVDPRYVCVSRPFAGTQQLPISLYVVIDLSIVCISSVDSHAHTTFLVLFFRFLFRLLRFFLVSSHDEGGLSGYDLPFLFLGSAMDTKLIGLLQLQSQLQVLAQRTS